MSNSLSVIRVEGNLRARKTRGNLPLPLFGEVAPPPVRRRTKAIKKNEQLLPNLQYSVENEWETKR